MSYPFYAVDEDVAELLDLNGRYGLKALDVGRHTHNSILKLANAQLDCSYILKIQATRVIS